MSEFLFKNLSVKLFPSEGEIAGDECACCSYICQGDSQVACRDPSVACGLACSNVATPVGCDLACSRTVSPVCGNACSLTVTPVGCVNNCTNVASPVCLLACSRSVTFCGCSVLGAEPTKAMAPPGNTGGLGDVRAELAAMKRQLRQRLTEVEAQEEQLAAAGRPKSIEQIDRMKAELLAAVDELDEHRAQMEGGSRPA